MTPSASDDVIFATSYTPAYISGFGGVCTCGVQSQTRCGRRVIKSHVKWKHEGMWWKSSSKPEVLYIYFPSLATWVVPVAERRNLSKTRNSYRWTQVTHPWCTMTFHYRAFVYSTTKTRLSLNRKYKLVYGAWLLARRIRAQDLIGCDEKQYTRSAKSCPSTAYCFHANVRATSQYIFQRSWRHSKVCCVAAQTFSVEVIGDARTNNLPVSMYYALQFFHDYKCDSHTGWHHSHAA